jgi:2-polyprenyl-3-methyl-5-hydroxy-6-metoxy-1,4-benzoquinol methylase
MTNAKDRPRDQKLSEKELCPDELLAGQEAAFARDMERLKARRAEFVHVPCPACGAGNAAAAFQKFTFDYCRCPQCRTLFMTPRPAPHVMAAYYADSENYRYWAEHIFPASEDARREKIHRPRLERVLSYCATYAIPTKMLMEVGPGFGTFSALAAACGRFEKVVAVEPTPELAAACRERGMEVIERRVEDIPPQSQKVDVAVAFEVIEHLFAPRLFLSAMAAQLVPGGLLVLTCPNGLGFDIEVLGPASLAVDAEHVNLFNPASLSRLVSECGFEVLETSTPGRLDAEFVRDAVMAGRFTLKENPFLQRVLIEEWDSLGHHFQTFLADNGLSSHMWLAARKRRQ